MVLHLRVEDTVRMTGVQQEILINVTFIFIKTKHIDAVYSTSNYQVHRTPGVEGGYLIYIFLVPPKFS